MSSAGHVFDMINRMKANRELAKGQGKGFKKVRGMYLDDVHFKEKEHKERFTPEQVAKAKIKYRRRMKVDQRRSALFYFIVSVIVFSVILFLLHRTLF